MRDSALKQSDHRRFKHLHCVGEELMRDSALKLIRIDSHPDDGVQSEKSSCATAL